MPLDWSSSFDSACWIASAICTVMCSQVTFLPMRMTILLLPVLLLQTPRPPESVIASKPAYLVMHKL